MNWGGISLDASTGAGSLNGVAKSGPFAAIRHAQASFTNMQWYCYQARQTVYFSAFSAEKFTEKRLIKLARDLMAFAPQLATGYAGAVPGQLPDDAVLAQLVELTETVHLDAYPDAWPISGETFYDRPDLPMFRLRAVVRKGGADEKGRVAAIQVLSTHALLEGVDSALLSRSQVIAHDEDDLLPPPQFNLWQRLKIAAFAGFLAPAQLLLAAFIAPRTVDYGHASVVLERVRLRRVALALGVRQRSLMFALVAYALNGGSGFNKKSLFCTYTDLEAPQTFNTGNEFFRFRLMEATFKVHATFAEFAQEVDSKIGLAEGRDATLTQRQVGALFGVHRRLKNWLPFLYPQRIFRFTGFYDMDLSLVPPHRLSGPLAKGLLDPIYCGTYHEGLNVCVFAPGRKEVTLNFAMKRKHMPQVQAIAPLLDTIEAGLS